jgi:hypothetical protein
MSSLVLTFFPIRSEPWAFGWKFWNQQENWLKEKKNKRARKSCDSLVKKKTSATK